MEQKKWLPLCARCHKSFNKKGRTINKDGVVVYAISGLPTSPKWEDLCDNCQKEKNEEERLEHIKKNPSPECPECGYCFEPIYKDYPINFKYCEECFAKVKEKNFPTTIYQDFMFEFMFEETSKAFANSGSKVIPKKVNE